MRSDIYRSYIFTGLAFVLATPCGSMFLELFHGKANYSIQFLFWFAVSFLLLGASVTMIMKSYDIMKYIDRLENTKEASDGTNS